MKRRTGAAVVTASTVTCALGDGNDALADGLTTQRSGLRRNDFGATPLDTWIGRVDGLDAPDALPLPWRTEWDCRATRLAWRGLRADGFVQAVDGARARHGRHRVGLVVGTSSSTIGASETAYRSLDVDGAFPAPLRSRRLNTPHGLASFVTEVLRLDGPALTVSTACSSSAQAFGVGARWLRLGLADAVVVAGIDALSDSLLFGFHALGLLSSAPCRPFDSTRSGISIGEAAGYALLERPTDRHGDGGGSDGVVRLLGCGASNDAHHMSSPHPLGLGAEAALDAALAQAGVGAHAVDHVNLHGTASRQNDDVEAALVARRYGPGTRTEATKGLTGHTMGAAGIVEAALCWCALRDGGGAAVAVSHSFGFGGNNCVLVFGR